MTPMVRIENFVEEEFHFITLRVIRVVIVKTENAIVKTEILTRPESDLHSFGSTHILVGPKSPTHMKQIDQQRLWRYFFYWLIQLMQLD